MAKFELRDRTTNLNFRKELHQAPAHPLGMRVLVKEIPPLEASEGGLILTPAEQERFFRGHLLAVGDQAADKLCELGVRLGDEVHYGKYAGLVEEWQHLVGVEDDTCPHDSVWDHVPSDDARWAAAGGKNDNVRLRSCRSCGVLKITERIIALSVEDLIMDADLQARLESGESVRYRGETTEGLPRYYIKSNTPGYAFGKEEL